MSLDELEEVYLTVGTPSRRKQKSLAENVNGRDHKEIGVTRPILGEKGLGRLSVMRLGSIVHIHSSKKCEQNYNELDIDWRLFSDNSDAPLESIEVEPYYGVKKAKIEESGTTITVYGLNTIWTVDLLQTVAKEQLSKFVDPFAKRNRDFISLWFNDEPVVIPNINKLLFENAHAFCKARLDIMDDGAILSGFIDYRLYKKDKGFSISAEHLLSIGETSQKEIASLGPFEVQFYWFNNRIVKAIDGIGKIKDVRDLIKDWAGGLMVYRDGFRIFPYGGFEDDWLKLDDTAFSSGGYKVNRRQVVGKVDITSLSNPKLVDQTNREGLRDSPEKQLLIRLLQHVMWTEFKAFLESVEKDRLTNEPISLDEIEERMANNEQKLNDSLNLLML